MKPSVSWLNVYVNGEDEDGARRVFAGFSLHVPINARRSRSTCAVAAQDAAVATRTVIGADIERRMEFTSG
jgi:hypothetical protein